MGSRPSGRQRPGDPADGRVRPQGAGCRRGVRAGREDGRGRPASGGAAGQDSPSGAAALAAPVGVPAGEAAAERETAAPGPTEAGEAGEAGEAAPDGGPPTGPKSPVAVLDEGPPTDPQATIAPSAWSIRAWSIRRRRPGGDLAGWAFAAVTVLPTLLLLAWLATGLALLLAGRFVPAPMLLIAAPVAAGLGLAVAGRPVSARWAGAGLGEWAGRHRSRAWVVWLGLVGVVAVAAGFGIWQGLLDSPQVFVDRGPGVATQSGFWIAQFGSLPISQALGAFGGAHAGLGFATFGFAGHGAALAPQVASGLPMLLAAGLWAHGLPGAALVSPILGAFAVLAVGGLTGRLAGPPWAPVGALLLAVTLPEMYTSRSAFGETLAQALLFGGLCLVVDSLGGRQSRVLAAVGGLALGLTALAGFASVVALLPVIPFLGLMAAARRAPTAALGAGLVFGAAYGLIGDAALSGTAGVVAALKPGAAAIAVFAAATALGVALALPTPVRRALSRWLSARPLRWLPDAAAVGVALVVAGFAVRPYAQTVRGPADGYVAALQRIAYLPADPGRRYSEDTLYWVIWYLGTPALVLGTAGLALLARRCLRALAAWRDPAGVVRAWALPAGIFGWGLLSVLWRPSGVPDQPWASAQLVPVVLPGLVVTAVWMAAWLIARARERQAGAMAVTAAAACFTVALAGPAAVTSFGVGARWSGQPGFGPTAGGVALQRTGAGQAAAAARLCRAIPANSSAVILDEAAARRFAQVIRGMCGIPAGVMTGASVARVQAVIAGIERVGRRPAVFASQSAELAAYGAAPSRVLDLATRQDAHVLTQPPSSTWPVRYVLWMSAPGGGPGAAAGT